MSKSSQPESADAPSPESQQPTGFRLTARRITGWTSNLLASAIVIATALTLGRHFVSLDDDPPPQTAPPEASPWKEGAHFLRLGEGRYALTRHTVSGDRDEAAQMCRKLCRRAAESSPQLPPEIDDYERRLLQRVESMDRVEESDPESSRWAVYQMPGGSFPLLIATREPENTAAAGNQNVVAATRRMVAWTMAVPDPQQRWNIYVFRNSQKSAAASVGLDIPPPPGAVRTVTLAAEDGSGQIGFRGGSSAAEVTRFYDRWLTERQFDRAGDWQVRQDTWQARFVRAGKEPVNVDIQFGKTDPAIAARELSGLITISPTTPAERKRP